MGLGRGHVVIDCSKPVLRGVRGRQPPGKQQKHELMQDKVRNSSWKKTKKGNTQRRGKTRLCCLCFFCFILFRGRVTPCSVSVAVVCFVLLCFCFHGESKHLLLGCFAVMIFSSGYGRSVIRRSRWWNPQSKVVKPLEFIWITSRKHWKQLASI